MKYLDSTIASTCNLLNNIIPGQYLYICLVLRQMLSLFSLNLWSSPFVPHSVLIHITVLSPPCFAPQLNQIIIATQLTECSPITVISTCIALSFLKAKNCPISRSKHTDAVTDD